MSGVDFVVIKDDNADPTGIAMSFKDANGDKSKPQEDSPFAFRDGVELIDESMDNGESVYGHQQPKLAWLNSVSERLTRPKSHLIRKSDRDDAMDSRRDDSTPHWEEADESNGNTPVRMSRRSGVVPVSKPAPNEHTKLLDEEDVELEKETKEYFHTKYVGLFALFLVIWTNIFQAEAVQYLQTTVNFKKPFFVMCFCHAAPALLLPFIFVYYRICGTIEDRHAGFDITSVLQRHSIVPLSKLLRMSAFLGIFYLVADYFWFSSLQNLTVAAGAAIFNSSPLFVYCFSICLLHEKVSVKKLFGVLLAFIGVTMVVLYQGGDDAGAGIGNPSVIGGLMMITSAILNAGYNVSVALTAGSEINDTSTLMIMMGLSGLFTLPAWFAGTIFFAHSPFPSLYEPIGFPPTAEGNVMLAIGIVMFATNFVFLTFAVCWTSPLETSVGFMLTIPLSGLMDTLIHHASFTWQCIVGSTLVMTGFLILELSSSHPPSHHSTTHEGSTEKAELV